ncbi:hypothetical protein [Novosphingobium terrae]|uniref:hypothetical protein n=1 Tax=Novosphingobium terrae TaxID=2726189 RepID=UPI00197FF297|nr:hypothetical protein [Novosphingobium terrae]
MYKASVFRTNVIDIALHTIGLYSVAASDLLLGTAVQESGGFRWNRQLGNGPARGYFQMEVATHNDIWTNYLKYRHALGDLVKKTLKPGESPTAETLVTNEYYAAAMARVRYKRAPAPLPPAGNVQALADYWKQYYNTAGGRGNSQEFVANWARYVQ